MFQYIKILRPNNLIIIVFTQLLMRYFVIAPLLKSQGLALQMPLLDFILLVLTSMLIAAAGYVINDYFDVKTDRINRPNTVIVDRTISRRKIILWHFILNGIAMAFALFLALRAGNFQLIFIQILSIGLLWFYSTDFKKQAFIGNLIVAFLTGLIPIVVMIYEMPWLKHYYEQSDLAYQLNFKNTFYFVGMFALFAFLSNLIREIIKDIEDAFGDEATGCKTLPIVIGIDKTKYVVYAILCSTVILLGFVMYKNYSDRDLLPTLYLLLFVALPLTVLIYFIFKAQHKKDFSKISRALKIIMIFGICFSFIIYYLVQYGNNT